LFFSVDFKVSQHHFATTNLSQTQLEITITPSMNLFAHILHTNADWTFIGKDAVPEPQYFNEPNFQHLRHFRVLVQGIKPGVYTIKRGPLAVFPTEEVMKV
jgi:hypothetical protein